MDVSNLTKKFSKMKISDNNEKHVDDDIFGKARSLPTMVDLLKIAQNRGIRNKDISGKKKKELSNFLDIPLIFNPNYMGRRPDINTLRLLSSADKHFRGICCRYKKCKPTTVIDLSTSEKFRFHSIKSAQNAVGSKSRDIIQLWGFQLYIH